MTVIRFDIEEEFQFHSLLQLHSEGVNVHLVQLGGPDAEYGQYGLFVELDGMEGGSIIAVFHEAADLNAVVSLLVAITNAEPVAAAPVVKEVLMQMVGLGEGE